MGDDPKRSRSFDELLEEARESMPDGETNAESERAAETQAPVSAVKQWLVERWGEHKPCPYCGNTQWYVGFATPLSRESARTLVAFPVICRYCGHAALVTPDVPDLEAPDTTSGP